VTSGHLSNGPNVDYGGVPISISSTPHSCQMLIFENPVKFGSSIAVLRRDA
jgi:hypothetical protein